MREKRVTAAHEVGHALVAQALECRVRYIRNTNLDSGFNPEFAYDIREDDHQTALVVSTAGVGGVMALYGLRFGRRNKVGLIRRRIAKSVVCYWWSRCGDIQDWSNFERVHIQEYQQAPSWPTFLFYAQKGVNIILKTPSLFLNIVDILEKQGFISENNLLNLISGKAFDEAENEVARTLQVCGLVIGKNGELKRTEL